MGEARERREEEGEDREEAESPPRKKPNSVRPVLWPSAETKHTESPRMDHRERNPPYGAEERQPGIVRRRDLATGKREGGGREGNGEDLFLTPQSDETRVESPVWLHG